MSGEQAPALEPEQQEAFEQLEQIANETDAKAGEYIPKGEQAAPGAAAPGHDPSKFVTRIVMLGFHRWMPYWVDERHPPDVRVTRESVEEFSAAITDAGLEWLGMLMEKWPKVGAIVVTGAMMVGPPLVMGLPRVDPELERKRKEAEKAEREAKAGKSGST